MRLACEPTLIVLVIAIMGCGGGDKPSSTPKNASGTTASHDDDSIADVASREGLPTLGGGGQGVGIAGSLRLELVDKENPIRLDGTVKEWTLVPARTVVKGTADTIAFKCGLAYDAQNVYFAGDVTGVKLRHLRRFTEDEDHASLVIAAPASPAVEVAFFPGKPGESAGVVRIHGQNVPGAKIIEADSDKGYTFEAEVPWSAIVPPNVRVALRGVARFHDGTRAIVATGSGDAASPRDMPALPTESEEALVESFLVPKGLLATTPKFELLADVRGDAMKERIAVYDRYLTVVGPNYRDGKEFFFRDLGSDLEKLEARDLTGRGKQDLVLYRQFGGQDTRQWLEVWSFLSDEPTTVFSHEISVAAASSRVTNAVRLASKEIEVSVDAAVGFDSATYNLARASDTEPVLLPWGAVKSQTFRFDGAKFSKTKEVAQAATGGAAMTTTVATVTTVTRPPDPPTITFRPIDPAQLLARYHTDRGVPGSVHPTVDLQAHVDGDARPERVMLIGRDIVVLGPGFKGGSAYAYLTLSQFADAGDIEEMTTRDLTGDGAAEIIVRGVRHVSAQGAGTIDMHVMFVYQLKSGVITRVFGIETARAQGNKRIQGNVQIVPGQHGLDVDVHAGRAQGWTDKTYPFTQDQPGGALEPLLLPWGGIDHVRYAYNGTVFARAP